MKILDPKRKERIANFVEALALVLEASRAVGAAWSSKELLKWGSSGESSISLEKRRPGNWTPR